MSSIAKLFGNKHSFSSNSRFWFFLILLLAAVLRFYRLPEYLQFLGDEGRDVLIVKRMIVDHQWTLLGPSASVGGFYVGPIYYYFMLPFLWLAGLDPVGPAVMAGLFGLATVAVIYYFCQEFFGQKAALLAAFLVAISPEMVYISRFSWNPNPTAFFTILTIWLVFLAAARKRAFFSFLAGVSLGIMVQLHYTNLVLAVIIFLVTFLIFPFKKALSHVICLFLGFILGNSLFLVFEFRHNFPNIRSVLEFSTRGRGAVISPRSFNLLWLFNDMIRRVYEIVLGFRGPVLNAFYYASLAGLAFWSIRAPRTKAIILILWLVLGAIGIGSYQGQLLDHYFGFLYPLPFLALVVSFDYLFQKKITAILAIILLVILTFLEIQRLYFWQPPNNLLTQTKTVDKIVLDLTGNEPYNFALGTLGNSDHAYRYFLEIWGRKSTVIESPQIDPLRKTITNQLIVVCEGICSPLGYPLWEVAGFGRGEITQVRDGPAGIKVFKLLHYRGG